MYLAFGWVGSKLMEVKNWTSKLKLEWIKRGFTHESEYLVINWLFAIRNYVQMEKLSSSYLQVFYKCKMI